MILFEAFTWKLYMDYWNNGDRINRQGLYRICLTTRMIQRCERLHEVTQQQSKVSQAEWRMKQFARAERMVEVVNPYV